MRVFGAVTVCALLAACYSFNRFHYGSLDINEWNDRAELYLGPFEPSLETVVFAGKSMVMRGLALTRLILSSYSSTQPRSGEEFMEREARAAYQDGGEHLWASMAHR